MVISDFNHAKRKASNLQHDQWKKPCLSRQNYIVCPLSAPMFFANTGDVCRQLYLIPGKLYTFGRSKSTCDIIFEDSRVSRRHCQLYLDSDQHKLFLLDGTISASEENNYVEIFQNLTKQTVLCSASDADEITMAKDVKPSLNGIYVNRSRLKLGHCKVLSSGDQVSLVCDHTVDPAFGPAIGFIIWTGGTSSPVIEGAGFGDKINGRSCRQMTCSGTRSPLDLAYVNETLDPAHVNLLNGSVLHDKTLNRTENLFEKWAEVPKENRLGTLQKKMTEIPMQNTIGTLKEKRTHISNENILETLKENFVNNVSKSSSQVGLLRTSTGSLIEASKKLRCSLLCNQENEQVRSNDEICRLVSTAQLASTNKNCEKFEPSEVKMDLPIQLEVERGKNVEEERVKLPKALDCCMSLAEDTTEAKENSSSYAVGVKGEEIAGSFVKENKNHCSGNLSISKEKPQERVVNSTLSFVNKIRKTSNGRGGSFSSLHEEDKQSEQLILQASSLLREETVGNIVKENKNQDSGTMSISKGKPQDEVTNSNASLVTKSRKLSNGHKGNFSSLHEEDKQSEQLILQASSLLKRCRDILRRNTCAAFPKTCSEKSAYFIANPSKNAEVMTPQKVKFVLGTDENSDENLCKSNTRSSKESQVSADESILNSYSDINKKEDRAKEIKMKNDSPPVDCGIGCSTDNEGISRVHAMSCLEHIGGNKSNSRLHPSVTDKDIHCGAMQGGARQQALSIMGLHNQITYKDIQRGNVTSNLECQDGRHLTADMQVHVSENEDGSWQMKQYANQQRILAMMLDNEEVARNTSRSQGMVHREQTNQTLTPHNKNKDSTFLPKSEDIMKAEEPCAILQSYRKEDVENTAGWEIAAAEEHTYSSGNIILGTENHSDGNWEKRGVISMSDLLEKHLAVDPVNIFSKTNCTEASSSRSLNNPIISNFRKEVYPQYADGNRQQNLSNLFLETEEQVSCSNANKQVTLDLMTVCEGVTPCRNVPDLCFGADACPWKEELQEHRQNVNLVCKNKVQSAKQASSRELNTADGLDPLKGELCGMTDQETNVKEDHALHMGVHTEILQAKRSSSSGRERRGENNEKSLEEGSELTKESSDNDASLFSGETFYLNRLEFMELKSAKHAGTVSLWDLLAPVDNLLCIFSATFTSDILWFLSSCKVPNDLPVTVACHNSDRCWSRSSDQRWSKPYPEWPNLTVVYPSFPDAIAFGKDHRQGVGCHHPKMLLLHRRDSMRVIITSANLTPHQWLHVTNTVWWQDFPRRSTQDYQSLFTCPSSLKSKNNVDGDFAAQLAGFLATLVVDVPSEAHWVAELAHYDFKKATGYLVASIPGVHGYPHHYPQLSMSFKNAMPKSLNWRYSSAKYIGAVPTSVVGLSYRFHAAADPKGERLKALATLLNARGTMEGMLPVSLKRAFNVVADSNAISVIVCDAHGCSEDFFLQQDLSKNYSPTISSDTGYVHLGFLCKDAAQWIAPLWDGGLFSFAAYIWPQKALATASGRSNNKVQIVLYVFQGQKFPELSTMPTNNEHHVSICKLLASLQRPWGLWRLQEVLSPYKWPDSQETDFIYGSSSIGTSLDACFLAAFSAAAGRKSIPSGGSDESDPEWGCWNAQHESKNPSIGILFPTIEQVKCGKFGTLPYNRLLCFAESTWERLKSAHLLHDAIPHPSERIGFPMHVKVARRHFQYHSNAPSFGWIYCGSHNFSPAAWGRPLFKASDGKAATSAGSVLGSTLHICNYEIGIVFIVPPPEDLECAVMEGGDLGRFILPFMVPAPKYQESDRPATAKAMREAQTEMLKLLRVEETRVIENVELVSEEAPIEVEVPIEDSEDESSGDEGQEEEGEEEKVYAETLWSQIDSCHS